MGAYNAILDTLVTEAPKIRRNPAESGGSWTILLRFTPARGRVDGPDAPSAACSCRRHRDHRSSRSSSMCNPPQVCGAPRPCTLPSQQPRATSRCSSFSSASRSLVQALQGRRSCSRSSVLEACRQLQRPRSSPDVTHRRMRSRPRRAPRVRFRSAQRARLFGPCPLPRPVAPISRAPILSPLVMPRWHRCVFCPLFR